MTCWELRCKRKITKSECIKILKDFRKRIFSRITAYKAIELILAIGGMCLHVCQPVYQTSADRSLIPGVLGAFIVVGAVLLVGHLFNFTAPTRLNSTFSVVGTLGYGWCMSWIMDSLAHEFETRPWTFLLAKGTVCFAALAIHLLELLHTFVTRDTHPWNLRINDSIQVTRTASREPV